MSENKHLNNDRNTLPEWSIHQWPVAAFICFGILIYLLFIMIVFWIRRCLVREGVGLCCNCKSLSEVCLDCAQCCNPPPCCTNLLQGGVCSTLSACCPSCTDPCICCQNFCKDICPQNCLSDMGKCPGFDFCNSLGECSSLDCLCCEITIKGRPPV